MMRHIRVETYFGPVVGVDVDVVNDYGSRIVVKDWNGYKELWLTPKDYWVVMDEYRDIPLEALSSE